MIPPHRVQTTPSEPPPPNTLGRWRLGECIGQGAWTQVFAAAPSDQEPARFEYALKLPRRDRLDDPHGLRHLATEARVASTVQHPRLLGVLDHRLDGPHAYLVAPRLEGRSAAEAARQGFGLSDVIWTIRQAAEAVAALHAAGWLHGDLTLENIFVSDDGSCTLVDLGLARRMNDRREGEPLQGSPDYLPPEVLQAGAVYDLRAEVYSLGVCLERLLDSLSDEEYAPLACVTKAYALAAELTAPSPSDRPASAGAVIRRLTDLEISLLAATIAA